MSKLSIALWNVNGIRAVGRKKALRWVDELQPDILGLQEIKAEAEEFPDDLFEKSYRNLFVNASSAKKGQSGTALYTDIEGIANCCSEVDILHEGRINEFHFENIAFFNVYFPNGKRNDERLAYKMAFYDRFLSRIEALRKKGKSIIFGGDLNTAHRPIDLARPKENEDISGFLPMERAWIDKVIAAGYIDTFRHVHGDEPDRYSWWSMRTRARERNVGWRIDYLFVSEDLQDRIIDADILDRIEGSDHAPITLTLSVP